MQENSFEDVLAEYQKSPLPFIEDMWGLRPQPFLNDEARKKAFSLSLDEWSAELFGTYDIDKNEWRWSGMEVGENANKWLKENKYITWQQYAILLAVSSSLRKNDDNDVDIMKKLESSFQIYNSSDEIIRRISIRAGHGIGKSTAFAWLIIWFLFSFYNAQVPCTAPTSDQMHDVLWKEVKKWLDIMPDDFSRLFDWSNGYIRIVESPETWFARAKTARKESPEALAGVHGEFVMFLVDESSGVPEEIFNTAEGALTEEGVLFLMISNPTRLIGYFYDSHHGDKKNWLTFHFSCIDSPMIDKSYVERIKTKHGEDSDEFRVRVLGEFPKEDAVDDKGYVPLLTSNNINEVDDRDFVGELRLGVDPSGEGKDESNWVVRDSFVAKLVAVEKKSSGKSIARTTLTIMEHFGIKPENVRVDIFGGGEGTEAVQELAIAGRRVKGVNVGKKPDDQSRFYNKRAEVFFRIKEWVMKGGELVKNKRWEKEGKSLKYRTETGGRIKIMGKQEMRKAGYDSPNAFDALSLTFVEEVGEADFRKKVRSEERLRSAFIKNLIN